MNKIEKLFHAIKHNPGEILAYVFMKFGTFVPDRLYLKVLFRLKMKYKLDLDNPKTFSEKLQWLKLYDRKPEYTTMVDKYAVKKYIADKIGEEYIIPTIGVWDKPEDIDFDKLPNQFVLKTTHGGGGSGVVICKDKVSFDKKDAIKKLNKSLRGDIYKNFREWPYKNVTRKIIAEKYLEDADSKQLTDYKVLCFNGEPKLIEIHKDRFNGQHVQDFYDTDWKLTNFQQPSEPTLNTIVDKPIYFDEFLRLSKILAEGMIHIRVDWYIAENKLYFGELTFFDGSGFCEFMEGQDEIIGEYLSLPQIN